MSESEGALEQQVVAIGIPASDRVVTWWAMDFSRLMLYMQRHRPSVKILPLVAEGSLIPQQRQNLVDAAMKHGATHMLWLDTDMRFPNTLLARLLDRNLDIVGANYAERRAPFKPVAFRNWNDTDLRAYTHLDSTGVERIAAIGSGALLVKMSVYEKLDRPYYLVGYNPSTGGYLGEDMYFSFKAGQDGFAIYVDHDVSHSVRHHGAMDYSNQDSIDFANANPEMVKYTPTETEVHKEKPVLLDRFGEPLQGHEKLEMVSNAGPNPPEVNPNG